MLAATLNSAVGSGAMLLGLTASVIGAGMTALVALRPRRDVARWIPWYAALTLIGALLAVGFMERALITRDFTVKYVQQVGSPNTPAFFNVAALWSALEGSLLLWILILAAYLVAVVWRFRSRLTEARVAWTVVVMFVVAAFFFLVGAGPANAFVDVGAPDFTRCCRGPNPLLQNHILVAFHPPLLYLGYVGVTVPFAFALGALIAGRSTGAAGTGDASPDRSGFAGGWMGETRRWALAAWGFLSIGILLGGWWSYEVLGWGGVWGWDPVENASLLPWITLTAYLHSAMVERQRGLLRVWNLSLLVATFSLTMLGTFLTRSGTVNSVHAFSAGSVGGYLLAFFALVVVVSLALIAWRGDELRRAGTIRSPLSREGAFLANNVVFAVFALVVLIGTVFPLIVQALQDRKLVVGAPFFNRLVIPIGIALLALMAVAPVLTWRAASWSVIGQRMLVPAVAGVCGLVLSVVLGADGLASMLAFLLGGVAASTAVVQLVRNVRARGWRGLGGPSSGGMVVHLGVLLVAVALVASTSYERRADLALRRGEVATFAGHTFELRAIESFTTPRSNGIRVRVAIDGGREYAPALSRFTGSGMAVGTPSVRTGLTGDVYLALPSLERPSGDTATVVVYTKPLTLWMWVGGGLIAVGVVLALLQRRRRTATTAALDGVAT